MASQDNDDTSLEISDFETQFVPQEDDDETLYRVIEITDEKANQYKVKWDGINPKTKKPWAQSWVKKRDCTDDLVLEWKRKKAQRRASAANTPISGLSKASGSRSKSTESPAAIAKLSRLKHISTKKDAVWDDPPAGPSINKKRKKPGSSHSAQSISHPSKRRKTKAAERNVVERDPSSDVEGSYETPSAPTLARYQAQEDSSQSEEEDATARPKAKRNKGKGKILDNEEQRSKSSGSTRRSSSAREHKGKKKVSSEGGDHDGIANESDASNTSDPHPRPRSTGKPRQRSRQIITSSQDVDPSPPSPSFGEPSLLHDIETVAPNQDRPHSPTTRAPAVSASRERQSHDFSEDERTVPFEEQFVKFPPRSERRRSKERSSIPPTDARSDHSPQAPVANPSHHTPTSPLLSPSALARLKEFDEFFQVLEEEEKQANLESVQSPTKIPSIYLARRGTSEDDNEPARSPSPSENGTNSQRSSPLPVVANELAHSPSPPRAKEPSVPDESFEIVPETETQSSTNTQRSPERSTVVSKMKPRTPGRNRIQSSELQQLRRSSSNERAHRSRSPRERSLKPVPVVSPSAFTPYILPGRPKSDTDDEDEQQDTIEQFSSPEKSGGSRKLVSRLQKEKQAEKDRQDHDLLQEMGLAMYDKARKERVLAQNGELARRKSLSELLKPPSPSESTSPDVVDDPWDDHLIPEEPANMDLDMSLPNPRYPSSGAGRDSPAISKDEVSESNGTAQQPITIEQEKVAGNILQEISERHDEELQESRHASLLREREDELIARSERITALEREIVQEREESATKIAGLEAALTARAAQSEIPQPDTTTIKELETALQKATADKTSFEKDRDFFREEWSKASGHVTLVLSENAELKERARIAETRATEGLAMIKATFEARVKFLEENAKQAQRLANFVMEKDQRTNDVIRSRAAQYPELKRRLDELNEASRMASEQQDLRIEDLEDRLATSKKSEEAWRAEVLRLSKELNDIKAQRVQEGRPVDIHPDTHVYRCQFRDGERQCGEFFVTLEELDDHYYYSSHMKL